MMTIKLLTRNFNVSRIVPAHLDSINKNKVHSIERTRRASVSRVCVVGWRVQRGEKYSVGFAPGSLKEVTTIRPPGRGQEWVQLRVSKIKAGEPLVIVC